MYSSVGLNGSRSCSLWPLIKLAVGLLVHVALCHVAHAQNGPAPVAVQVCNKTCQAATSAALSQLYLDLGGQHWLERRGWPGVPTAASPCQAPEYCCWDGVVCCNCNPDCAGCSVKDGTCSQSCSLNGSVVALRLSSNNLTGSLAPVIPALQVQPVSIRMPRKPLPKLRVTDCRNRVLHVLLSNPYEAVGHSHNVPQQLP